MTTNTLEGALSKNHNDEFQGFLYQGLSRANESVLQNALLLKKKVLMVGVEQKGNHDRKRLMDHLDTMIFNAMENTRLIRAMNFMVAEGEGERNGSGT